jgi:hypothetical protein
MKGAAMKATRAIKMVVLALSSVLILSLNLPAAEYQVPATLKTIKG